MTGLVSRKPYSHLKKDLHPRLCFHICTPHQQLHQLVLPLRFTDRHSDILPIELYYRVPGGRGWPVKFVREGKNVMLRIGWTGFASYYGIECGYLLTVGFNGDNSSRFHIYDSSNMEVDYKRIAAQKYVERRQIRTAYDSALPRFFVRNRFRPCLDDLILSKVITFMLP